MGADPRPGYGTRGEEIVFGWWRKEQICAQSIMGKRTKLSKSSWTILSTITIPKAEASRTPGRLTMVAVPGRIPQPVGSSHAAVSTCWVR